MVDGRDAGALGRGESVEMEVPSGAHTLQLVHGLGLASPVETFSVRAGETAAFAVHSPSLVAAIPRAAAVSVLHRGSGVELERTGHHADGGEGGSADQDLIVQITAAQANQPGIQR